MEFLAGSFVITVSHDAGAYESAGRGWLTRATMQPNGYGSGQRLNASHVVESELEHLEWAMRQPMVRLLNARYWQRRVLEVKCGYELTAQQGVRIERMLKQLASRPG